MYGQLQRTQVAEDNGNSFIYTYMGVLSSEEKPYEKIDFSDMADADVARCSRAGRHDPLLCSSVDPAVGTEDHRLILTITTLGTARTKIRHWQ